MAPSWTDDEGRCHCQYWGFHEARLLLELAERDLPAPSGCRHGLMMDRGLLSLVLMVRAKNRNVSLPIGLEEQDLGRSATALWSEILPGARLLIEKAKNEKDPDGE